MATCAALVRGRKGECLAPVPDDAPIFLCYLHALLAHQFVEQLGGAKKVAEQIRKDAA